MNDLGQNHILVIGEHAQADVQLMDTLNNKGQSVLYASSGRDAIEILLEYDVLTIIIDIHEHSTREIESALLIRSSDRFKQIPIIFLFETNPDPGWSVPTLPPGPIDYIIKPVNRFILNHKLSLLKEFREKTKNDEELRRAKKEMEIANSELQRLTEDLEKAISNANKMALEAEIATITKSGFLASMSHEIRTPLNAVVGFTDLMMDTDLTPEQKEYNDAIRTASNTFLELINDILDFSKIEADMVHLEDIPFSPETIIDDVLGTLGMKAYEKNLELASSLAPDVPETVVGDPVRVKQILMNLVGNAIKFTTQGEIIVTVTREFSENQACCLHFSVCDSGIGIPESKWDKLFQPFSQANQSTTREFGGTGLGLAISKRLAELMRGNIWIQSPNPESTALPGTIFHVRAVFGFAEPEQTIHIPKIRHGSRALISEKNPNVSTILCTTLDAWNVETMPVNNPALIMDTIIHEHQKGRPFSHVFLDISHGVDGILDLARSLRNDDSFHGQVILMLKPVKGHASHQISDDPAIDACIRKPAKRSALLALFRETRLEPEETALEKNMPPRTDSTSPSLRVLLVEDNKINQKVASKMLNRMGHTVSIADNGKQALEILDQEQGFDLILMDGQMPVMDGFQATDIIRRREKNDRNTHRIPIIALTANAMKGDRVRYIHAGMDDYIAKPVKIADLADVIGRVMTKKNDGDLENQTADADEDTSEF